MTKTASLLLALICLLRTTSTACSAYKISADGKTMAGSNYDSWFVNPVIWFETEGYGAAFSGARREEGNRVAPQTGLNIHGLSFVTLAAPPQTINRTLQGTKPIASRSNYLKDILHTCKSVEEVRKYVEQYDRSLLFDEVMLYTDSAGNYLIVEPNVLTTGNDASYVLANFCPSTVSDLSSIRQERYIRGSIFAKKKPDASLAFCTAMSDTMHVCREKIGDGTLLTSILDLEDKIIHLYFYHDYKHHTAFNLSTELEKGDHQIEIVSLFPINEEYEKFLAFKTPATSSAVHVVLWCGAFFFGLSSCIFLVSFFMRKKERFRFIRLLLFPLNMLLAFYMLVLLRKDGMYYFPAPYEDYQFSVLTVMGYVPFLLVAAFIPLAVVNRKLSNSLQWSRFGLYLLTANSAVYLFFIALFSYWGFYSVL